LHFPPSRTHLAQNEEFWHIAAFMAIDLLEPDTLTTTTVKRRVFSMGGRRLLSVVILGCLLGGIPAFLLEIGRMILTHNSHVVLEGRVYRTAQLKPDKLAEFVLEHKIKTVVNLRGRPIAYWYPIESQTTQFLGIGQEDVTTSANRLPSPNEMKRLVEVLDRCEYPIVLHCQQGADRTGLAAAIVLLLYSEADYKTARRQCSTRYGHIPYAAAAPMDKFFALYDEWLGERAHTPTLFRTWLTREYQPGKAMARLEMITKQKLEVHRGQRTNVTIRATNISRETWAFCAAGQGSGVKVRYIVDGPYGRLYDGRAGYRNALVAPGESIDIDLPLPSIYQEGEHRLIVDLTENNVDFVQYGSEPLTYDWYAR
jgi:predicted protein tyrosine phosphatase